MLLSFVLSEEFGKLLTKLIDILHVRARNLAFVCCLILKEKNTKKKKTCEFFRWKILFENRKRKSHGAALNNLFTISLNIGVTSFSIISTKDIARLKITYVSLPVKVFSFNNMKITFFHYNRTVYFFIFCVRPNMNLTMNLISYNTPYLTKKKNMNLTISLPYDGV